MLSLRLKTIADLVSKNSNVIDIGTDHAYLPIYLYQNNITNNTSYLIVGNDGNPCWAYSCYGRKVEDAIERRKKGQHLTIVNEVDFWDALA